MTATLEQVTDALEDSIQAGVIDLVDAVATEPDLAGLGGALSALRITTSFELTGVAPPTVVGGRVTLTGAGSYGLPGATPQPVTANLEYTIVDQRGYFTLALSLPAQWTFGDTFANLPDCQRVVDQTVRNVPSYLTDLPLQKATLRARALEGEPPDLRLEGDLPLAEVFEPYADFFAPWPLRLDGTVQLPARATEPPDFDLIATSTHGAIKAGPIDLHGFGLELISFSNREPPDEESIPLTVLNAVATLALGDNPPVVGSAHVQLLAASTVWRLQVDFGDEGPTLGDGFAGVARAFRLAGTADFTAPPGVRALTGFKFTDLDAAIVAPGQPRQYSPQHAAVRLVSEHGWTLPVPFLTVSDLGMTWLVGWRGGAAPGYLVGSFFGRMRIDTGTRPDDFVVLDLTAWYPSFTVSAVLRRGEIPLDVMLARFLGLPPPPTTEVYVDQLALTADLLARTVAGSARVSAPLELTLIGGVRLTLVGVIAWIDAAQNSVAGGLSGELALTGAAPPGAPPAVLALTARYDGDSAEWVLEGGLVDSVVDLTALVANIANVQPPPGISVLLQELSASFAMGTGAYAFTGAIATRWTPDVLGGKPIAIGASAEVSRTGANSPVSARLIGEFQVARFALRVTVDLTAEQVTYIFEVSFAGRWIAAEVEWIGEEGDRHQIITIHIGGITVGELIENLVDWIAPTLGFKLDPPWDILGRIDLSRFLLVIDPKYGRVEVTYETTVVLPTMTVTAIGLRAERVNGKPTVVMVLHRAGQPPLSWDVLSDPPPTVPGEGDSLVRLDYLGLGQRIRLKGEQPTTLRDAIVALAEALKAPDDPDRNPLTQSSGAGLEFAVNGGWLVGLDITLADTAQLALVLLDPDLYGLAVGLRGNKAGALAGLRFDVLYHKVSGDVGVFRAELELPDALRRFQLGAVSVTLGVLVVEVFTNGDFRVDLGFPHERDFSRSFAFEVLPFLGRGGIMVAKLSAATSDRVPAITNGTFSPVLELGVGFAVGIGKEFRAGSLSGGAYVEVIAIFDGVFAWFNPTAAGAPTDVYHHVNATISLHGKLYAQIDLSVLKIAVTVEAWAEASITLEAYRATDIRFSALVEVKAELTIGTFTIPLSFSTSVEFGFTVGTDRPTPWIISGARAPGSIATTPGRVPRLRLQRLRRLELLRLLELRRTGLAEPGWDPRRKVFPNSPRTAALNLQPLLSITDIPLAWSTTKPAAPTDPHYRAALLLLARTDTADGARLLIEALLRWSIATVTGTAGHDPAAMVTAAQLRALAEDLDSPQTADGPFGMDDLATFFRTNLHLRIGGDETGSVKGSVLPIPPRLTLVCPQAGGGPRDLDAYQKVGPLYLWGAARYAAGLTPTPPPPVPPPADDPSAYLSYDTYLFRDWCLMTAKTAVDAAVRALDLWPVTWPQEPTGLVSLKDAADLFPTVAVPYLVRAGDTVDSVAAALGASPAELRSLNDDLDRSLAEAPAGKEISINLGVSPEGVAIDNAGVDIAATGPLDIGVIDYSVAAGDTLISIAARFSSRPVQTLFPYGLDSPLATDRQLLAADAEFTMPATQFVDTRRIGLVLGAAVFFTRYHPLDEVESSAWYAAAIVNLNVERIHWDAGDPVPVDFELYVPAAYNDADPDRAGSYFALPGDTISSIARALALAQLFGTGTKGPQAWPQFRDSVTPIVDDLRIPETKAVPILPRESLADLSNRLITSAEDLDTLLGYVADKKILAQLAVVPVPDVTFIATGQDLIWLSDRLGLSIEDLAGRLATAALFRPEPLSVAHVPVYGIDDLVDEVLAGTATIGARTSRNLLSGTRLPAPAGDPGGHAEATGPLTSIVDLTGQQFPAPKPDDSRPGTVGLELTATVNTGDQDWIALVEPLAFRYTNAELKDRYPATSLAIAPKQLPAALPDTAPFGRTYGLDQRIEIQAPFPIPPPPDEPGSDEPLPDEPLPDEPGSVAPGSVGPGSGDAPPPSGLSAWPLPAALIAYAAEHTQARFDVVRASRRPDASDKPSVVKDTTFAALIPLRVRHLAPHRYELIGVDVAARDPLLFLWERLPANDPSTLLYLAVRPAPDAGNPAGLAVLDADTNRTFIVRTNQSKQTAPPTQLAPGAGTVHYADLVTSQFFLRLLWEGSVIGGAGYGIGFAANDGSDLPPGIFDENGVAALTLLALTAEERKPVEGGGRPVFPHETCALVPGGLDASVTSLWVESDDDSDTTTEPVLPQGSAGFGLTLEPPSDTAGADARLRRLFTLVRYAIPGQPFQLPDAGLPAGPLAGTGEGLPLWRLARRDRRRRAGRDVPPEPEATLWRYEQVLPLSRFAPASPCPQVPGLPPPAEDPYRGAGAAAVVHVGLSDVLGNVTTLPGDANGTVALPVRYSDPVLGLASWPGITTAYWIDRAGGQVRVRLSVAIQPATLMPALDGTADTSAPVAARAAERYARAYYQLVAGRTQAAVVTTLRRDLEGAPAVLPVDPGGLWRLSAAGYLAACAAAGVTPVHAGTDIRGIVARYGCGEDLIAAVNADQPAKDLLGDNPTVPAYRVIGEGRSAADLLAGLPDGWPRPGSAADLLRLPHNAALRLRTGAVMSIVATEIVVGPTAASLAQIAAHGNTAPGLLAQDNAGVTGILEPTFTFEFEGVSIVAGTRTIADVVADYERLGVVCDAATLGTANTDRPGMLVAGARLTSTRYLAQPGDTIATNRGRHDLAAGNGGTPDIFPPDTLLSLGTFDPELTPIDDPLQTLTEYADRFGCPPGRLLAANADRPLSGEPVLVPGAVRLPASPRVPYTVRGNDTLAGVAALFGQDLLTLAEENAPMPGTLAPGLIVVVELDEIAYQERTVASDSLAALQLRFAAQNARIGLADVVAAIATAPGYLAEGVVLSTPAPRLPGTLPLSPVDAAGRFGLDPVALCLANAGVHGLIEPGVRVGAPGGGTVDTGTDDTLNSLIARFAASKVAVGLAEIVDANRMKAFLRGGATMLLPPVPVGITVAFAEAGPFTATAACPLTVALRLLRPGSAGHADATVPPQATKEGETRTLGEFAKAFHQALPDLRLATGSAGDADLWLVNFGAGGLCHVEVAPGVRTPNGDLVPRTFAIRPLYSEPQTRRGVSLPALKPNGELDTGPTVDIQAVDVQVWARRFLSDMDTVLSTGYACGLYDDEDARDALGSLLQVKTDLTGAIAQGVAAIVELDPPPDGAQLDAAKSAIRDRLSVELAPAYDTAALAQYDATVHSPWTRGDQSPPARLLGNATPTTVPEVPYQLTAAKTALNQETSTVTFALSVADPARQRSVEVALDYDVTHLEHDIKIVGGATGYPASRWLTFYPPLRGAHRPPNLHTGLGMAPIPIPLRAYPVLPALISQSADPTVPDDPDAPPKIAEMARWTYGVTYAHEHAAQDEVRLTVAFNMSAAAHDPPPAPPDMVTALARYIAVADQLSDLLAPFGGAEGDRGRAAKAALSMAELAGDVADLWRQHDWASGTAVRGSAPNRQAVPATVDQSTYQYGISATSTTADGSVMLSTVRLRIDQAAGPGDGWPQITCRTPDGTEVELSREEPDVDTRVYKAPDGVPWTAWLTLTLRWPGLHVSQYSNARASVSVRRNAMLLDSVRTNPAFLFQAAEVSAPAPVSPTLVRTVPIDIGPLGADVGPALAAALSHLTADVAGVYITISAWYGYDLATATTAARTVDPVRAEALRTRVPVTLLPRHLSGPGTGALVARWLRDWRDRNTPPYAPGRRWLFSITVHSNLTDDNDRPLLVVDQLGYAISAARAQPPAGQ